MLIPTTFRHRSSILKLQRCVQQQMGCGCCTANDKVVTAPTAMPPRMPVEPDRHVQVAEVVSELVETEPSSKYLYLLGVADNKKPRLIQMDPERLTMQELPLPKQTQIYNYSSMVCIGPDKFLVSGGISVDMSDITDKCFIIEPLLTRIEVVQKMRNIRYTHIVAYHSEHVYVFGGRQLGDDDEAIINKCERFSLLENKWSDIPPLKVQRCTGFSLVWKNKIYVFGGYTSEFKRSKTIEIFDPHEMEWSICPFKLHQGLECGSIAATNNPNEFVLFGGNMKYGAVSTVNSFNLELGTVHTRPKMKEARVLQKSTVHNNNIFILGGCENDNIQICNLDTLKWQDYKAKFKKTILPQELDVFAHGTVTCVVKSGESKITKVTSQYSDQVVFLFGTDAQPFILEFNISVPYAISHPVPLSMRCYSFQGGVSIPGHKYILLGGITDDLDESTKHCYEFDGRNLKARSLPDMMKARYAFSTIYAKGYVYVLGGRNEAEDVDGLMDECERFNVGSEVWESIHPLPMKCVSSCAFVYKQRVYVTGGYLANKDRNVSIYLYEETANIWKSLPFQMPFGIEASALLWASEKELLFFGGRVYTGDIDSVWQMIISKQTPTGVIQDAVFVQVGTLSETKSLHKVYHPRHQDFAVVFGGQAEKSSFYNLKTHKMQKLDLLSNLFSTFEEEVRHLQDPTMKKYLLLT